MTKEELNKMPMALKDKETGKIWKSDGKFHTATLDWNYDGDVYTDTVMRIYELEGNGYSDIHEYEFYKCFEVIKGKGV